MAAGQIYKGKNLTNTPSRATTKQEFYVPLLSTLFGVLQGDKKSYKFLPLKNFANTVFEFRLSQFAFFSSGYNDTLKTIDLLPINNINQIPRSYVVRSCDILVDIYYFDDVVEKALSEMIVSSGIFINTCKWDLVKTCFLKKGRNIANRWLIN